MDVAALPLPRTWVPVAGAPLVGPPLPSTKPDGSHIRLPQYCPAVPSLPALRVILSLNAQLKKFHSPCRKSSLFFSFFFSQFPTPRVSKDPQGILICSTAPSWLLHSASACCLAPNLCPPHTPNLLPFLTSLSSWTYVEPGSSFLSWGSTA